MSILNDEDFKNGRYRITVDPEQETDLDDTIETVENDILPQLFGVELYDLFIADLVAGVPQSVRFVTIFDAFNDQTNGCITQSQGMKVMLKGYTYYDYVRDINGSVTPNGTKKKISENSTDMNGIQYDLTSRYNDGVRNYKAIQHYMNTIDPDTYPEYDGTPQPFNHIY
jgi:hypothetical protein